MKTMMLIAVLLAGCATVNPYAYDESAACPSRMTEEEHTSGVVRCRAMCSSYSRDMDSFDGACKCWCKPQNAAPLYTNPMHQS